MAGFAEDHGARRWHLAIVLLTFVSGCATVGTERVEQLKVGSKIVPLSLMGDTLAVRHVGTIVFENARGDMRVPGWEIDRYLENLAARLLRDNPKVSVVAAQTADARRFAGKTSTDFWTSQIKLEGGTRIVTELAQRTGADYVLVVAESSIGDPFFRTNQSFSGYGIYQRHILNQQHGIHFVTMRVALLDGKTGAEVSRTQSYGSAPRAASDWMERDALKLSADSEKTARSGIEQVMEAVMRKCLTELKLN